MLNLINTCTPGHGTSGTVRAVLTVCYRSSNCKVQLHCSLGALIRWVLADSSKVLELMARILLFSLVVVTIPMRATWASGQACLHPASSCLPAPNDCMHQAILSASSLPACMLPACLNPGCIPACIPSCAKPACMPAPRLRVCLHQACMPACTKPACLPAPSLHACLHQACMPASMLQLPAGMHANTCNYCRPAYLPACM
jgi:hypothetical protein